MFQSAIHGTSRLAVPAAAKDLKTGILFGLAGPIEFLTPMADGDERAMKVATDNGLLSGGATVTSVRGNSICPNALTASLRHLRHQPGTRPGSE
jgi:branched-chain amino acid transport system substrate-binding protein